MMKRVDIRCLATGVPGLDEVLGGGLPEFSFNLIAGPPGSGKTTLAHHLMFKMASPERRALYFTGLGEPPLKMLRYQQQFAFFDGAVVNDSLRFVNLAEDALTGRFDQVLSRIVAELQADGAALVFFDSFCSLALAGMPRDPSQQDLQQFIQQLALLMTGWQATTFLVGEFPEDSPANPLFTVADGLIWLSQSVHRNSMVRKLQVGKLRGQPTLPGLHTFRISAAGVEIFPPATAGPPMPPLPRELAAALSDRASIGVPGLDEMMDGGLPRGYSLLVAGPSGSGKSILASAFLAEGARCGETGVLAAFEQNPHRSRHRVVADLIAQGSVGLVVSQAPDLSIDEIARLLISEIRRLNATRVVLDSLSGLALALAPTFRDEFRESLSRLVTALARTGVTLLMTSELEDRYTDLRFSPYGTAFMTDAIIVHRYIEVDSRLRRVMAVVKLRASAHSDQLRLYSVGDDGIHMDQMLSGHEGLLSGRPALRQGVSADVGPFSG